MSNLTPISTYNLALKPFTPSAAITEDYPITVRITLAAVDAEAIDDKAEPSTLRLLKRNKPFLDDDEDDYDEDSDELDSEEEESSEEEEQPKSKKSNKNKGKKVQQEEEVDVEDSDEDDLDLELDDEEEDVEEFVICTLSPKIQFQQTLDLTIIPDEEVYFVVTGSYPIHLVGNYVEHPADEETSDEDEAYNQYGYDDDEEDDEEHDLSPDEDEIIHGLQEIEDASDVENKIEELVEEENNKKSKKRNIQEEESNNKKSKKEAQKTKADKQVQFTKNLEQGPTGSTLVNEKEEIAEPTKTKKQLKKERQEQQKKELAEAAAQEKKESASDKKDKKFPTKTLLGGVVTEDRKLGKGPGAKSGNKVGIRYIGKLKNGKVFDKNTSGKPFVFGLGKGECIKGFDLGVAGMAVGGERRVVIPPKMGYGSQALPGLPANSELTFDIKLVSLK